MNVVKCSEQCLLHGKHLVSGYSKDIQENCKVKVEGFSRDKFCESRFYYSYEVCLGQFPFFQGLSTLS